MNVAVVFPGQGSQSVGMLVDYEDEYSRVRDTFTEASDTLGYDLWDIVANGPEDKLNQTEFTQPAMLCADVAIMRVLSELCLLKPFALAGHSLGEYAALVAADSISYPDAIKLVAERARLMQNAVPEGEGAMAAILGLDDASLESVCDQATEQSGAVVEAVNYNAPGQVVIAGETKAVELAMTMAGEAGAKRALPLPVSVPSHSSLMKDAALELGEYLEQVDMQPPKIPVIQNVDGDSYSDVAAIRDALVRQLYNPVQWVRSVKNFSTTTDALIECGPGKVLSGLCKRIDKSISSHPLNSVDNMNKFLDSM